jgi:ATP-dependent DNA helicase RecQ
VFKALRELENAGYISFTESVFLSARLMIQVNQEALYKYQLDNPEMEPLIKTILRSYGGCFEDYTAINENSLSKRISWPTKKVIEALLQLHKLNIIDYIPKKTNPQLAFLVPRVASNNLVLGFSNLEDRRIAAKEKIETVIKYINSTDNCRGRVLLSYFGEDKKEDCGHCDYCINKNEKTGSGAYMDNISKIVHNELSMGSSDLKRIIKAHPEIDEKQLIDTVRWMVDHGIVNHSSGQLLELKR